MAFHISVRLPHLLMAVSLIVVLCCVPFKLSQNNNSVRSAASWLLRSQAKKNKKHLSVCQSRGDANKDLVFFLFLSFIVL